MPTEPATLSDPSSCLAPSAFQGHFRRLESLQTLMAQGGVVVSEVAQFLTRAREELHALQREQASYADVQQRLLDEKAELTGRVAQLEAAAASADERARHQEELVAKLKADCAAASEIVVGEESAAQRKITETEAKLTETCARLRVVEHALQRERELRASLLAKTKQEDATLNASEIAQLKTRLASVEQQLETERERRVRLMEVVKSHEVIVASHQLRHREAAS
jgi:chromosome segregation ATPase